MIDTDLNQPSAYSFQALSMWHGPFRVRVTMREIIADIAGLYGFTVEELTGPGRTKGVSNARQHAMYLMAQQQHLSLPQIGRFLGNRDHTTVLHGVRAHKARMEAQSEPEAA